MKRLAVFFLVLCASTAAFAQQSALPAGAKQHPSYRSPDGLLWVGVPGGFFPFYTSAKVDSIINGIPVKNLTAGDNIILNKTNPDNWIISSTGGGSGSSNWGDISGDLSNQTDLWTELLSRVLVGGNITLLNNNAGYIVGGTGADEVRTNADLDARYLQEEVDPTVPQYVKDISTGDISNWNSKISSVTGGVGITVDASDPYNLVVNADGGSSITLTGDVTGTGEGTIATTIADNAVTTGKIQDGAVTLTKMQQVPQGTLLGSGGLPDSPWQYHTSMDIVAWSPSPNYAAPGMPVYHEGQYYEATGVSPNINRNPATNPSYWAHLGTWGGFYATPQQVRDANITSNTYISAGGGSVWGDVPSGIWVTLSSAVGVAPGDQVTPVDSDLSIITVGDGLLIDGTNRLNVVGVSSIAGLLVGGTNTTITGLGTLSSPFQVHATGGGGSGGDTYVVGGTGISVTGTGSSGNPFAVSSTISNFTRSTPGYVPAPGGSTATRVLYEDGQWRVPSGGGSGFRLRSNTNAYLSGDVSLIAGGGVTLSQSGNNITINSTGAGSGGITSLTGDVLASGSGSVSATIANGAVSNAKLANMAANTIKGRAGTSGVPQDLSNFDVRKMINTPYNLGSSTAINLANGSKQYRSVSGVATFTFANFDAGLELQVEITNTSGSNVIVTFSGATFPVGETSVIPAGRTAVFSMTKFNTIIRATRVIY